MRVPWRRLADTGWWFGVILSAGVFSYFAVCFSLAFDLVPPAIIKFLNDLKLKAEITVGDGATVLAACAALLALVLGWHQLRGLTQQTRATVLLTLDARWEGEELLPSRTQLNTFVDEVRRKAGEQQVAAGDLFPTELERLRTSGVDREGYLKLMKLCGFFETVGYTARTKYIRVSDVHNLLGGSIREAGVVFREHIINQQRQWTAPRYYENLIWLIDEVRKSDGD
jgi:hypothetical protein